MSAGYAPRQRSASAASRPSYRSPTPIDPRTNDSEIEFQPCAATATTFLFAQDSSIICVHHDTLAVDRRFELHKDKVLFLSVDNVSERGSGRLVVSYDSSQTAIVWDLFTGNEIARFASYEAIRVAAWMKNGNIAFGMTIHGRKLDQKLTNIRQQPRSCHPLRNSDIRTCLCPDHFRSHHGSGAGLGLSDLCDWVRDSTGRVWQLADNSQIPKRFHLNRNSPSKLHNPTHIEYGATAFANRQFGLACLVVEAKIRYVGNPNVGRRFEGLEHLKTGCGGSPKGHTGAKAK